MTKFKDLNIEPKIQKVLDELGFTQPTEIQEKAIPILLDTEKVNFHGQAQTGTGKTLAFAIPLLQKINPKVKATQALIVAPTRELAFQIYETIKILSKHLDLNSVVIYGGTSIENQIKELRRNPPVIIGTPGRIRDHLRRKTLSLDKLNTLVLDEADIMLDMGFKEEIEDILTYSPKDIEIWLFSATVKPGIKQLVDKYMQNTVAVRVSRQQVGSSNTKQYYCVVPFKDRLHALVRFIESTPDFYGFVFTQTKILAAEIAEELVKLGYNAGALHGDMSQAQRNKITKKFKNKEISVLVATDVAARGIDISDITHVINYSVPEDLESYVHRIGRTGRAGKTGTAITFTTKSQVRVLKQLEKKFKVNIEPINVPSKEEIVNSRLEKAKEYINNILEEKHQENRQEKGDLVKFKELVENLPSENKEKIILNLLWDKFLKQLNLKEVKYTRKEEISFERPNEFQELSLGIGDKEEINKEDVIDFLVKNSDIKNNQIKSIRILRKFTFVKLSAECSPNLFKQLRNKRLKNRKIHVKMTCIVK